MLLCGCTKTGRTICAEHRQHTMNDYATVKLHTGPNNNYELVYFEDRCAWFIRSTDRATGEQAYSESGYDSKREAAQAFDGQITYVAEAPGQS